VERETAVVDVEGNRKVVDAPFVRGLKAGDYVMVHSGLVLGILDDREALEMLRVAREVRSGAGSIRR